MAGNDEIPTGYDDAGRPIFKALPREDDVYNRPAVDNDYNHPASDRLGLETGPDRLPWLETDDEPYELERTDGSRILGFALLGLVALAAIIGGIWWATNRPAGKTLIADGSTVPAPTAPFKILPEDPGGKKFDGTGDSAFAVSEGKNPPAKLGEASAAATAATAAMVAASPTAAAKPAVELGKVPAASPSLAARPTPAASVAAIKPVATPTSASVASHGPVVQVGAYSTRALADAAWTRMAGKYSSLSGQRHQVIEGQADIGKVFRLQVISGENAAANALCGKLKSAGLACQVKN